MELNNKILKIGLTLIFIILIFIISFVLVYRLDNPVFLKMYVEEYIVMENSKNIMENFELKYITNLSDNRKVVDIYFPEAPNIKAYVSNNFFGSSGFSFFNKSNQNQTFERYGIYLLKTIYITGTYEDEEFDEIEINNAKVVFDDGSTLDVDLGRIILHGNYNILDHIDSDYIGTVSASSSSSGKSNFTGAVEKYIKLKSIESPLFNDLGKYIDISINGNDYGKIKGLEFEDGETLTISSTFSSPNDILNKYTFYDIKPRLYYEDREGNTHYIIIYNINYTPYGFNTIEIFKYLKMRGEI